LQVLPIAILGKGVVNFICSNVHKATILMVNTRQADQVGKHGLEQAEGADDVDLSEFAGAMNAAVDIAFGGKIDDGAGLVLGEQICQQR